jgi:hypothetical protein
MSNAVRRLTPTGGSLRHNLWTAFPIIAFVLDVIELLFL